MSLKKLIIGCIAIAILLLAPSARADDPYYCGLDLQEAIGYSLYRQVYCDNAESRDNDEIYDIVAEQLELDDGDQVRDILSNTLIDGSKLPYEENVKIQVSR